MDICEHKSTDLFVKDICYIFSKKYRTILSWLKQNDSVINNSGDIEYSNGKFPHAYKCNKCGRIIIPSSDVSALIKQMKEAE